MKDENIDFFSYARFPVGHMHSSFGLCLLDLSDFTEEYVQ